MRVVSITDGYEQTFWEYVNRDRLDYYFFIMDWNQRREKTRILLALDEDSIEGALLLFDDYIAQLRGNRNAVKALLEHVNLEKMELQAPLDCEDLMIAKFEPRIRQNMILMSMNKGEERVQITALSVKLGVDDAEEVVGLLRRCDPVWWGEVKAETVRKSLETAYCLGIKKNNKVVSVGYVRSFDFATNISIVATDEDYRNRDYATSIVSALVQEIFKHSSIALIHVIADNAPAVRAYSKVGFKPYKTYLSIRT